MHVCMCAFLCVKKSKTAIFSVGSYFFLNSLTVVLLSSSSKIIKALPKHLGISNYEFLIVNNMIDLIRNKKLQIPRSDKRYLQLSGRLIQSTQECYLR